MRADRHRARREDDLLHARLGRGAKDVRATDDARLDDLLLGILRMEGEHGGDLEHAVDALHRGRERVRLHDVGADDLEMIILAELTKMLRLRGVSHRRAHAIAVREQLRDELVTDVTVRAGDEDPLHFM